VSKEQNAKSLDRRAAIEFGFSDSCHYRKKRSLEIQRLEKLLERFIIYFHVSASSDFACTALSHTKQEHFASFF